MENQDMFDACRDAIEEFTGKKFDDGSWHALDTISIYHYAHRNEDDYVFWITDKELHFENSAIELDIPLNDMSFIENYHEYLMIGTNNCNMKSSIIRIKKLVDN